MKEYKSRSEVPEKYKWDLTKRYQSDEEWYQKLNEAKKHVSDLTKYKGHLFEKDNLYHYLKEYYIYVNQLQLLLCYASLKQDEDVSISKYNKMFQEVLEVFNTFNLNNSYFSPELLHDDRFEIKMLVQESPKLKEFEHILEEIALEKNGIQSEENEKIISILTKDMSNYENNASVLLNSEIDYGTIKDENGQTVELNTGNYAHFMKVADQSLRKKAYLKMNKKRKQYSDTLASNLIGFMSRHAAIAKIRNFPSTKEMDFTYDGVPINVHESLKKNVKRGLSLFQEYHRTIKNILGLKKLNIYDLNAPIVKNEKKYTVEEAKEYVYEATKVLGEDYGKIVKRGFKERWVDYMPYKGKRHGGYCNYVYGANPNILLSFIGSLDSISTIAHEMGHAVNMEYLCQENEIQYAHYDLFTAEIPSLLNEILLTEYILQNKFSKEEKISAIASMLNIINGNFFTAIQENEFEEIVYEKLDNGESLTTDDLTAIMSKLINEYYGNTIEKNEYISYMWTRRSHYFDPWYLYKYSTCICGAIYFANGILKGDKNELKKYKQYLKYGAKEFPNDIFLKFGIDLKSEKLYDELFLYYEKLLNQLKELTEVGE